MKTINISFVHLSCLLLVHVILTFSGSLHVVNGQDQITSPCNLPPETGMCRAYFPRFYYDHEADQCKQFVYGGCQGNANNFGTLEECEGFRTECLRKGSSG